jgi:two-component system CheB/CheR fusion protein
MNSIPFDPALEDLLVFIRETRGFDLTGYKRSTLTRRFRRRMDEVECATYAEYASLLAREPGEFTRLFDTLLINVTGFWRDPGIWETLARDHLPHLLRSRAGAGGPLRVWTAGCASGEETYTVVMLLAEALGAERFREEVRVYATDLDEGAIAQARRGSYPAASLEAVPPPLRERYFEPGEDGRRVFRDDLRSRVVFGRHDLVRDPPISHLDLLVSRNTLMYFDPGTQARIQSRFHFALDDGGLLFLGQAETMHVPGTLFVPLDLRARIFRKVPHGVPRGRSAPLLRGVREERAGWQARLRAAVPDAASAPPCFVPAGPDGRSAAQGDGGASYRHLEAELRGTSQELETANEELRSALEELDAAREELQAARGELQCTHEEMETLNRELQSTHEELETVHAELRRRAGRLDEAGARMESLLASLPVGVAVLDRESGVRAWNRTAEEMWGLRAGEVEAHPIGALDAGLPVERLEGVVQACLDGRSAREEVWLEGVNRRGRAFRCRVTCTPLTGAHREIGGAVLVMEERGGVEAGGSGGR